MLPANWEYTTNIYNNTHTGDCVSAIRVCIHSFATVSISGTDPINFLDSTFSFECGYRHNIQTVNNDELVIDIVTLPDNILSLHIRVESDSGYLFIPLHHTDIAVTKDGNTCVLHIGYPTSELLLSGHIAPFGA